MRVSAKMDGLAEALTYHSQRVFTVVDEEVKGGGDGLRSDLRRETEEALGVRVANAWRGNFYLNKGDDRGPAAFIWTKAPRIIDFFSASRLVTPLGEAFAIPTENVPRASRGRRLSPIEVEARFNAELHPIRLKSGRIGLVLNLGKSGGKRRRGGRAAQPLLMFVLMKGPLRSRQLIDLQATADRWGASTAANIGKRLEGDQ